MSVRHPNSEEEEINVLIGFIFETISWVISCLNKLLPKTSSMLRAIKHVQTNNI